MSPKQAAYLLDILQSVEAIRDHLTGFDRARFLHDRKT